MSYAVTNKPEMDSFWDESEMPVPWKEDEKNENPFNMHVHTEEPQSKEAPAEVSEEEIQVSTRPDVTKPDCAALELNAAESAAEGINTQDIEEQPKRSEAACVKLENEKEQFLKRFSKGNEQFARQMEEQYDEIFRVLCEKCEAEPAFAEQVLQDHKTFENCYSYLTNKARSMATGNCAMVWHTIVYDWIAEYYALDERAKYEKKKAKKEADERKAAQTKARLEAKNRRSSNGKKEEDKDQLSIADLKMDNSTTGSDTETVALGTESEPENTVSEEAVTETKEDNTSTDTPSHETESLKETEKDTAAEPDKTGFSFGTPEKKTKKARNRETEGQMSLFDLFS